MRLPQHSHRLVGSILLIWEFISLGKWLSMELVWLCNHLISTTLSLFGAPLLELLQKAYALVQVRCLTKAKKGVKWWCVWDCEWGRKYKRTSNVCYRIKRGRYIKCKNLTFFCRFHSGCRFTGDGRWKSILKHTQNKCQTKKFCYATIWRQSWS